MGTWRGTAVVGVLGLLALVLAGSTALLVGRATTQLADDESAERVAFARAAAAAVRERLDAHAAEAVRLAADLGPWPADASPDPSRTGALDARLVRGLAGRAYVARLDGVVVAGSSAAAHLLGLTRDVSGAVAQAATSVSLASDPLDREVELVAAAPVAGEDGAPAAVLVTAAPLAALQQAVDVLVPPQDAALAVVAPDGTTFRSGLPPQPPPAGPDVAGAVQAARTLAPGGAGWRTDEGEAGVALVVAYAPAHEGWTLAVTQEAATFRPVATGTAAAATALPGLAALVLLVIGTAGLLLARGERLRVRAEAPQRSFLAVAGHELRTPLTVLSATLQTLERRGEAARPEFRAEALRHAVAQVRRLEQLIERLLFVAHLEAGGRGAVRPRPTDLAPIIRRTADAQQSLSPLHRFDVRIEEPLVAVADRKAVERIVAHLLDNAARYSPAVSPIGLHARRRGRKVEVVVEDEGVGLPSDPDRLFGRFVQGESVDTRVRDEGGVGVGLWIVRTLVEAMHGDVRAEPRAVGARFVVTLPAARPPSGRRPIPQGD